MRDKLLFLHRWLGLTAGVIFAVASLTGALLMIGGPPFWLLPGEEWATTPGQLPFATVADSVLARHPGARIVRADWPTEGAPVFILQLVTPDRRPQLFIDPGTARQIPPPQDHRVVSLVRRMHTNLFVGRRGSQLLVYACFATLASFVLAVYLWWPGIRRIAQGFRIRARRGFYILNFDLHQATGMVALPLLLIMTVTGVILPYPGISQRVDRLRGGPDAVATARSVPPEGNGGELTAVQVAAAAAAATGGEIRSFDLGGAPERAAIVELDVSGERRRLALDRFSGEILVNEPDTRPEPFQRLMMRLHVARDMHPVIQTAYMLACFVGALLLPTGVVVWWLKRTRKVESAERRSERMANV